MGKRILLVDDEPQLLFSLNEFLTHLGYDVIPAESGSQALDLLLASPPDLIVSDILMEDMDGHEFQRRVSALTSDSIPFVFLTAKDDLQDCLEGLRRGADDYVTKPCDPQELEARIAAIMNRVEQTRREERREIDNLRSRILAQVASKLRSPVTSLMAHLNLLLSDRFGDNVAEQERYLRSVLQDADVLCELINDLSWTASSQGPKDLSLKREPIRVAPVVRGAAAGAARMASDRGVDLSVSCGGLLSANIDGTAMTRALGGLLKSSVEMSGPGSQVSIVAKRSREGGLEFIITDGGCPPGEDSQAPLDLADSLSFARQVISAHAGQILTRRDEGGRQSFEVWVPGRIAKHVGRRT